MGDFMLLGILRMPIEADGGIVAFTQFRSAARSAAERIEALTSKCETLSQEVNMAKYGQPDFAWSIHKAAMADLQAYNARLRAALECLLIEYDYAELAHAEPPSLTAAVFSARAALTGKEPGHE
jgi:hypothetical protein